MQYSNEILLVAGEASGDLLGAELLPTLQKNFPSTSFTAMGGPLLESAGATMLIDSRHLAVIGLLEIATQIFAIRRAFKKISDYLKENRPSLIILIDYPGFNLRLAKVAHELGIKVIYYVGPKIWASRYQRIEKIKQYVDHMVIFFKFEEELYQREGVPVSLAAHPLSKLTQRNIDSKSLRDSLNLNPDFPIIALLPGSRLQEIKKCLPIMMEAKKLIQQSLPEAQFALPLASSLSMSTIEPYLDGSVRVSHNAAYEITSISQAAIVTSGTATLETALSNTPLVIIYKLFAYRLAKKWFIKIPYIGLCNIAAQRCVAKEMIQQDAKPESIAAEIIKLVKDTDYRQGTIKQLGLVRNQLGTEDGGTVIVRAIQKLIAAKNTLERES